MDPKEAWNEALRQFQLEVNKSTFETWVKDAVFLSFEDGVFRIGAANGSSRDWLQDRMTGLSKKILTGILGTPTDIVFEIQSEQTADLEDELDDAASVPSGSRNDEPAYSASPFWYSEQERIVKPTIGTFVPGYFVHYLPLLTHYETLVYFSLYRTVYARHLASRGQKGLLPASANIRVSNSVIARRSGIGRHKIEEIIRLARPGTWFGTLVRLTNPQKTHYRKGDHSRRLPILNVAMDLPLLPHHAEGLTRAIRSSLASTSTAEDAVRSVTALNWDVLLPFQPSSKAPPPGELSTIDKTIRAEIDQERISGERIDELNTAIGNLRAFVHRNNRTIGISDFLLGPWRGHIAGTGEIRPVGAFLLISYMRHRGFINFDKDMKMDEFRDDVRVDGGFKELADRLGIDNPYTVYRWLKLDWVKHFIRVQDEDNFGQASEDWTCKPRKLRIAMIDPIIPGES